MRVIDKVYNDNLEDVSEEEYFELINEAEELLDEDNLIRRDWENFIVVGDTHGYLSATLVPVDRAISSGMSIVFLGDYVDRGPKQLENLAYILGLKIQRPEKVILLRGNHEQQNLNRRYGFYNTLLKNYSIDLYDKILSLYDNLPLMAVINDDNLMVHGGIPSGIDNLKEINELTSNDNRYKEVFWNDPEEGIQGFKFNYMRGGYKLYGKEAFVKFLDKNSLSRMFRSHQCFDEGYKYFFDKKLLSLFSVPNYCGNPIGKYAVVSKGKINLEDI